MTNKPEIWFDVDGVLLDYQTEFYSYAFKIGKLKQLPTAENVLDYDLSRLFETPEECWQTMFEFSHSPEFENLKATVAAVDLRVLKMAGYSLNVITQISAVGKPRVKRLKNLIVKYGNVFDNIVFTDYKESKVDFLLNRYSKQETQEQIILIEDNPKVSEEVWEKLGCVECGPIRLFMVEHPYNRMKLNNHPHWLKGHTQDIVETLTMDKVV